MHARAGLGDDALLAHALGEQGLADGVVDLVRAGVIEVFALQVDLRTAQAVRQPLGVVDGAGAPDVVLQFVGELGLEFRIVAKAQILLAQLLDRRDQCLGHVDAAVWSEVAAFIGVTVSQCS